MSQKLTVPGLDIDELETDYINLNFTYLSGISSVTIPNSLTESFTGRAAFLWKGSFLTLIDQKCQDLIDRVSHLMHPATHPATMIDETPLRQFMTVAEKDKLAGIEENANNYEHPKFSIITNEFYHNLNEITDSETRFKLTVSEKDKLAGIAVGANNYTHPVTHSVNDIEGLIDDDGHLIPRPAGTINSTVSNIVATSFQMTVKNNPSDVKSLHYTGNETGLSLSFNAPHYIGEDDKISSFLMFIGPSYPSILHAYSPKLLNILTAEAGTYGQTLLQKPSRNYIDNIQNNIFDIVNDNDTSSYNEINNNGGEYSLLSIPNIEVETNTALQIVYPAGYTPHNNRISNGEVVHCIVNGIKKSYIIGWGITSNGASESVIRQIDVETGQTVASFVEASWKRNITVCNSTDCTKAMFVAYGVDDTGSRGFHLSLYFHTGNGTFTVNPVTSHAGWNNITNLSSFCSLKCTPYIEDNEHFSLMFLLETRNPNDNTYGSFYGMMDIDWLNSSTEPSFNFMYVQSSNWRVYLTQEISLQGVYEGTGIKYMLGIFFLRPTLSTYQALSISKSITRKDRFYMMSLYPQIYEFNRTDIPKYSIHISQKNISSTPNTVGFGQGVLVVSGLNMIGFFDIRLNNINNQHVDIIEQYTSRIIDLSNPEYPNYANGYPALPVIETYNYSSYLSQRGFTFWSRLSPMTLGQSVFYYRGGANGNIISFIDINSFDTSIYGDYTVVQTSKVVVNYNAYMNYFQQVYINNELKEIVLQDWGHINLSRTKNWRVNHDIGFALWKYRVHSEHNYWWTPYSPNIQHPMSGDPCMIFYHRLGSTDVDQCGVIFMGTHYEVDVFNLTNLSSETIQPYTGGYISSNPKELIYTPFIDDYDKDNLTGKVYTYFGFFGNNYSVSTSIGNRTFKGIPNKTMFGTILENVTINVPREPSFIIFRYESSNDYLCISFKNKGWDRRYNFRMSPAYYERPIIYSNANKTIRFSWTAGTGVNRNVKFAMFFEQDLDDLGIDLTTESNSPFFAFIRDGFNNFGEEEFTSYIPTTYGTEISFDNNKLDGISRLTLDKNTGEIAFDMRYNNNQLVANSFDDFPMDIIHGPEKILLSTVHMKEGFVDRFDIIRNGNYYTTQWISIPQTMHNLTLENLFNTTFISVKCTFRNLSLPAIPEIPESGTWDTRYVGDNVHVVGFGTYRPTIKIDTEHLLFSWENSPPDAGWEMKVFVQRLF